MSKVRYVNWTPSDWLAGTRGLLTQRQLAVYDTVLNLIYDRGGPAPNDAAYIAGHFRADEHETARGLAISTRASLDRLIELGKLHVSQDGQWLTNGRAYEELGKANGRIDSAANAGIASGESRRRQARADRRLTARSPPVEGKIAARSNGKYSHSNGLARTVVRNQEPQTKNSTHGEISSDPARAAEPHPSGSAPRTTSSEVSMNPKPRRMPRTPGDGKPVGPPDPEAVEKAIRDLGVDPADVPAPPAPAPLVPPTPAKLDAKALLAEKAAAARRKLMGEQ